MQVDRIGDVHLKSDGRRLGVVSRQNEGISLASNEWLVFLDCNGLVSTDLLRILDHYIGHFEFCRYIDCGSVDIDEEFRVVSERPRVSPASLLDVQVWPGSLTCIRRDLVEDIGAFDSGLPGSHQYDFALRAAENEAILSIPDVVCAYRSVSLEPELAVGQRLTSVEIRKHAIRRQVQKDWPIDGPRDNVQSGGQVARGACLVRTQGKRLSLLKRSLESIEAQEYPITPVVIVHGDVEAFREVQRSLSASHSSAVVLQASDTSRRRGHPLNVGLDHILTSSDRYDYLTILDDDDIYYPSFSARVVGALNSTAADVVFGLTNRREADGTVHGDHPAWPTSFLVQQNFIPTNSLAIRANLIRNTGCRFREDIHYLEDWDFLLSLLGTGARFLNIPEVIAEFLITGDGNTLVRQDPRHFSECQFQVLARGRAVARSIGFGRLYRDILDFNEDSRKGFAPVTTENVLDLERVFEESYFA
jgi:glycosyltransferase involved in cell wall biosynthesis